MHADVVIVNGRVHTLDDAGTLCGAIAIVGDRIVAVGDDADMRALAGPRTELIDARQRVVLPGFIDSHTHLRRASLVIAYYLDFLASAPRTVGEVLDAVAERAAMTPPGEWIQGDNLSTPALAERRFPHRRELDAAAPVNPVVIRGVGRHALAANSRALALAGIDRHTVAPPGGRIEFDESGEPLGVLHERAKLRLDQTRADTVVPIPGEPERLAALAQAMRVLNANGISCIHEMARQPIDVSDYLQIRERGDLTTRVRLYLRGIESQTKLEYTLGLGLREGFGDEWIRLGGTKFSIDGSSHIHNAALYEEYPGEPGNRGLVRIEAGELEAAVLASHRAGLQVAIHAIGQRAADMALDAFEKAQASHRGPRLPHRIEHAFLPPRAGQLERMARLGLLWSAQPAMLADEGDEWLDIFGEDAHRSMPLRTARELGVAIQLNSDYPCTPLSPFSSVHSAVTRRTREGEVLGLDEAISVDQALRYLTTAAGYSMTADGRQGRIAAGCLADVVVTDQDPYEIAPDDLLDVGIDLTLVGGRVVHRRID